MKKILLLLCVSALIAARLSGQNLVKYVNPFIGTGGHGHTYPGATVPFGMVQLSPDNGHQGWDWSSGYYYNDTTIAGFSHTHLSGTGIGDYCDISVMPGTHIIKYNQQPLKVTFNHKNEMASPGFYKVKMDNGITAALTATNRCGLHWYTFPQGSTPVIRFDLGFHINSDKPTECYMRRLNDSTVVGYRYSSGWAKTQRVYFAAKTLVPFKQLLLSTDSGDIKSDLGAGKYLKGQLIFSKTSTRDILIKVALSSVSMDKALGALAEIPNWNFSRVRLQAEKLWEQELEKIRIPTADEQLKRKFYTAIYHTCLAPVTYSDADGYYQNSKGQTLKMMNNGQRYTVYSLWDTFRALNPLFTIMQRNRYADILNSMMAFYNENGLLPVWDISTYEANTMTGYHAIPVLADGILKNMPGIDAIKAYQAMKASSVQQQRGTPDYIKYGYLPQDKGGWSVTVTLEYAFDDFCIAQVAKKLGFMDDYHTYIKRSMAYKLLFDPVTGFIRARNADGTFDLPFDPYYSEHEEKAAYVEGNAWQHSFFVPHDVRGLAKLHGSYNNFVKKLDSLFTVSSVVKGRNKSDDISGMIGQYAHGNEPSHHIAYLYTFVGKPWKTQEKLRMITDSMYHDRPDGYAGNEDCGQMSAWLVWNVAGMYPVNPVSGQYVLGSPMAGLVTIKLPGTKTGSFTIKARNNSKSNKYIQSALLNGKPYDKTYLENADLTKGGTLELIMGPKPSQTWGINPDTWPSSLSN